MALCFFLPPHAGAAQEGDPALQETLDALYERLLDDPADIVLNRRFIEVALALKDYDAAIGAVERLIFYSPDNPDLLLEAARYYLAIDSFAVARDYVEQTLVAASALPVIYAEATTLRAQINDETRASPWAFFGQSGLRYQTNANVGPNGLDPNDNTPVVTRTEDWNAFALGTLAYSRAVGNTSLEAAVTAYYAEQFEVDLLDLGFVELVAGPRIATEDGGFSVKPYGLIQGILLADDPYQLAYGGGVLVRVMDESGWYLEPQAEYKKRDYYNSDDYPVTKDQTGDYYTYGANAGGGFGDDVTWFWRGAFNQNDADADYRSYDQYSMSILIRFGFQLFDMPGWALSPFASVSATEYAGLAPPEQIPGITPTVREDFQWSAGATLEVPLNERLGLNVQFQYTENDSNLSRYSYENYQVTSGPTLRF